MPTSPQHAEVQGYTDCSHCTPTNTKMLEKLEKLFKTKTVSFSKETKITALVLVVATGWSLAQTCQCL